MIGSKLPQNLLSGIALGIGVGAVMLALFYGQYQWLAGQLVSSSAAEHEVFLRGSYERRMRAQLHSMADRVAAELATADADKLAVTLDRLVAENTSLSGLRVELNDQTALQVGNLPQPSISEETFWLADSLAMSYPILQAETRVGDLYGAFSLDDLRAESAAFAADLANKEAQSRRTSYVWIGLGTLATFVTYLLVVWAMTRRQSIRVRALKIQAEKLRDSDFGEALLEARDDELGELASVFNDMRDQLRTTTMSRDYFNSILSGMNEAIIVTDTDGKIKRSNRATDILLGYDVNELSGMSIEDIVDKKKTSSLDLKSASDIPQEAFFASKIGEVIPVSYTCSVVAGQNGESEDRIYAAQNITERRRAEQRIRYLARIDALTKIPNRMQFQHLLQRSIARARRAGNPLCLFYVDIDHFKEINDTFGHLAGDATLETVAERLTAALPENSIIG